MNTKELVIFWLAVLTAIIVIQGSRIFYYWLKDKSEAKVSDGDSGYIRLQIKLMEQLIKRSAIPNQYFKEANNATRRKDSRGKSLCGGSGER